MLPLTTAAGRRELGAAGWMALSALSFSLVIPLLTSRGGSMPPITGNAIILLTAGIACGATLGPRRLWHERRALAGRVRAHRGWALLAAATNWDRLTVILAVQAGGAWLTAIIIEAWALAMTLAIVTIPALRALRRRDGDHPNLWLGLSLAAAGASAIAMGSQGPGGDAPTLSGVGWAGATMLLGAAFVCATRNLAVRLDECGNERLGTHRSETLALGIGELPMGTVVLIAGLALEPTITTTDAVTAVGVGLLSVAGALTLRRANRLSRRLGVNALYYAAPALAVLWLELSGLSPLPTEGRTWILAGAATIIGGNMLCARTQRPRTTGERGTQCPT